MKFISNVIYKVQISPGLILNRLSFLSNASIENLLPKVFMLDQD